MLLASERTTLHDRFAGTGLVRARGGDGADIASLLASFLADRDQASEAADEQRPAG